jgi:hypothetical protein
MKTIEYRVRPVTRYVVTRYAADKEDKLGSCEGKGEFDSEHAAREVALALAKAEPSGHVTFGSGMVITASVGRDPVVTWTEHEVIREE